MARTSELLVASDYDGTLAEIVDNPADATALPDSMAAIRRLAALPHTHVAVISGRGLRDLMALTGAPPGVVLVGSHGTEFTTDFRDGMSGELVAAYEQLRDEVTLIARSGAGLSIEEKPAGIALHYRLASDETARAALDRVARGPASRQGIFSRHGKKVIELSVVPASKGRALEKLRSDVEATAVLFLGDDVTDEDAFAGLAEQDVGVKVGDGETLARYRVDSPTEVAGVLEALADLRARAVADGGGQLP
jgi:trehalose-phosphatase